MKPALLALIVVAASGAGAQWEAGPPCAAPLLAPESLDLAAAAPAAVGWPPELEAALAANHASGETGLCRGFAPGSLVRLHGRHLASRVWRRNAVRLSGHPLPAQIACEAGGCTVIRIGGVPAPILSLAPQQAVVQVPWAAAGASAEVVVETPGGSSAPVRIPLAPVQPGLYPRRISAGVCIPEDPLCDGFPRPGGLLELEGTGLGPVSPPAADGGGTGSGWHAVNGAVRVLLDGEPCAAAAAFLPGFTAGNYFVLVRLPADLPPGRHRVRVMVEGEPSNAVEFDSR